MIAILTEKPSVAAELAVHLGITQRKNGYWLGKGYAITWAFGHLVGLAMPEAYGIKGFKKESLPIIPDHFLLIPRQVKVKNEYKNDSRAFEQLQIINDIFERCDKIIVATDAGREGELIFRYIYHYLKCTKPFERLWISSLTNKAIAQGFENLQSGTNYDALYEAAKARNQADWLIGINATQALSIQANDGVYSLGRVQTPTLAMICKRYQEHTQFQSEVYWKIKLQHTVDGITFHTQSETSFTSKKDAQLEIDRLSISKSVVVTESNQKEKREQPPLLYDITGLQKQANTNYNLSALQTLNIAQALYEKKLISYPRTGSRYISEDMWQHIPELILSLENNELLKQHAKKLRLQKLQKRIINDDKVTDHHALLITENSPTNLTKQEEMIYQLIAARLLEAVSAPCIKEISNVKCKAQEEVFTTNGTVIISEGWRGVRGHFGQRNHQELPEIQQGTSLKIKNTALLEKQTQPKPLLTETTLLSAMENAGKTIENEEERFAIKEVGLGTPATRANTIELLFKRNYIQRQKKSLVPTQKGVQVYEIVKDKRIANVTMTGVWEKSLTDIEKGEMNVLSFQNAIESHTKQITTEILNTEIKTVQKERLQCPSCKQASVKLFPKVAKCTTDTCEWLVFRNICGKIMSEKNVQLLLNNGKTGLLKGLKSKANKTFDAYLILEPDGKTSFKFPTRK
ncbi:type IA DNA topoisomerase [Aquimarina algiphila]|uniref:type IA DNA topoisomerase n=1 Tax=Aquimarina algiphila TaxID=2047982 RepID=UPI00232B192C|nr:type IA DNA topoisomerase [Aquimarina algiphila]